jgi:hypothetical protein
LNGNFYRYANISLGGFLVFCFYILTQSRDEFTQNVFFGFCAGWVLLSVIILLLADGLEFRKNDGQVKTELEEGA